MKFIKLLVKFSLVCIIFGVTTIFGFYFYVKPDLPDVATLRDVKLQTPMQVFSQDGKLIAQFGEKRRIPLKLEEMPPHLLEAVIATEDSRFYDHFGFDPIGITRASLAVLSSGSASQGASTITQQLARNFFLSNEKKLMRKIKELFIAVHIEQLLTKEEILELYLNKIYLGYRSYGVGAAAQAYFGKEIKELTLSQIATIAGLPKAPSTMNPIYSLERATQRRNVVLSRMLSEQYITQAEYNQARQEPLESQYHGAEIELNAPYIAEIARAWMVERYGEEEAYTSGMKVYTTVNADLQTAANQAAINNLIAYDERHGYRGAERVLWQPEQAVWDIRQLNEHLKEQPIYDDLYPAIVLEVSDKSAQVWVKNNQKQTLDWSSLSWARRFIHDDRQGPLPKSAKEVLQVGEQIWVRPQYNEQDQTSWRLSQVPNAQTAFIAMNPDNGAVVALVGGFNFIHNKFNRVTQSVRQVGSSIKPFIYSAALESGLTLSTLINDAPINQWDESQGTAWRPKNSPATYSGPTRVRLGLAQSKNVMAVRVLRAVGLDTARQFLTRFGFELDKLPRSETIALGAGSLSPLKMAQGYSVFANGGYYVEPFYIERLEDAAGELVYQAQPKPICSHGCELSHNDFLEQDLNTHYAPQVISEQNAFLVREMLYSNIWGGGDWRAGTGWNGTGWRAQQLKRRDIGGKTGTTNDSKDAWYNGFAPGLVAISWVGFDDHSRALGSTTANPVLGDDISGVEAGAKTAQPAWVDFMALALKHIPVQEREVPEHIVRVRIDRETGLLTHKLDSSSTFEYFIDGTQPTDYVQEDSPNLYFGDDDGLF